MSAEAIRAEAAGRPARWVAEHDTLRLRTTSELAFVDITRHLAGLVRRSGLHMGQVSVQTRHTTSAVVINEDEPLLREDFAFLLQRLAPRLAEYAHDDFRRRRVPLDANERVNGFAHCRALLLPASVSVHVVGGTLHLGRWQRVFFVELDGPQTRELSLMASGAGIAAHL